MGQIENLVDQVISAFEARRRTRWSATHLPLTDASPNLKRWHQLVDERLTTFRTSTVDRSALLNRTRTRFANKEWTADFASVADELQNLARADLRQYLIDNGVPPESANQIAQGYSIGALLHDPPNP